MGMGIGREHLGIGIVLAEQVVDEAGDQALGAGASRTFPAGPDGGMRLARAGGAEGEDDVLVGDLGIGIRLGLGLGRFAGMARRPEGLGGIAGRGPPDRLVGGVLVRIPGQDRVELVRDANIVAGPGSRILLVRRYAAGLAAAVAEGGQPAHRRCRAADSISGRAEHRHAVLERRRCLVADAAASGLAVIIVVTTFSAVRIRRRTAQDGGGRTGLTAAATGIVDVATHVAIISAQQHRLGALLVGERRADPQHRAEFGAAGLRDERRGSPVLMGAMGRL